jgi:hypothetical protein
LTEGWLLGRLVRHDLSRSAVLGMDNPAALRQERLHGGGHGIGSAGGLFMTAWQYAQLSITRDIRDGEIRTIVWRRPGQGLGENFTGSGHSVWSC